MKSMASIWPKWLTPNNLNKNTGADRAGEVKGAVPLLCPCMFQASSCACEGSFLQVWGCPNSASVWIVMELQGGAAVQVLSHC
jgi:hypothetical protein